MKTQGWKRWAIAAALSAAALAPAYAQNNAGEGQAEPYGYGPMTGYGPGGGYGPGMMGGYGYGYGPGMMGGGYGYGPGMMGGYGYGPGMMGGYGYGPGMMGGGYGYGPGMMDGYGYGSRGGHGFGMMGLGPIGALNLDAQQRTKIGQIQQDLQKKNWELMGKLREEHQQLANEFNQEKVDPNKVGSTYDRISSLRKQMLQNRIQARNQVQSALTPQQRQQLQQWRQGAFGGPGAGGFGGPEEQE